MVNNNDKNLDKNQDQLESNEETAFTSEEISEEEVEVYAAEEEIIEDKEFIKKEEIKSEGMILHYIKVILSGIFDQILVLGLALVLFFVFDLILGVFGYEIVTRESMYMIMYIISNVLYYPLISELLHGKTLGRKLLFR